MQLAIGPHLDESELEQYSMERLPEARLAAFEEHLLACDACQDRLLEMEAFVNAVKSVSPTLRETPPRGIWREWFVWPRPAWAAAFALVLIALAVGMFRLPGRGGQGAVTAVFLQSARGVEGLAAAIAPAGQQISLNIDLTELPAFPSYQIEIVDPSGRTVLKTTGVPRDGKLVQPLAKGLAAGRYYVRLYDPGQVLIREFVFRAEE